MLSKGSWAYDADNSRLTLVAYELTEIYADEIDVETNEPGDGELLFDGKPELEGTTLVILEDSGPFASIDYVSANIILKRNYIDYLLCLNPSKPEGFLYALF